MSDAKNVSPLLDNWVVEEQIGRSEVSRVYAIRGKHGSTRRCILKHVSVPPGETQWQGLVYSGCVANEAEAHEYYGQIIKELEDELQAMRSLSDNACILPYSDYQIVEKEGSPGYDVYLIMEQLDTLKSLLSEGSVTHLRAVNMAVDICTALEALRSAGLLHRDVKPENIFIDQYGQCRLGDLGLARLDSLPGSHMPENLISDYSPPELSDTDAEPNSTLDTYCLGMILYYIYNGQHSPFEDEHTTPAEARARRLSGEALPVPMFADYEMAAIITRACAFDPAQRYSSPEEMKKDLTDYLLRNAPADELVVPPIQLDPDPEPQERTVPSPVELFEEMEPIRMTDASALDEDFISSFTPEFTLPDEALPDEDEAAEDDALTPDTAIEDGAAAPASSPAPKPKPSKRGGKKAALICVFILLVLSAAGVAAYFFWPTVQVSGLTAAAAGSESIDVSWENYGYQINSWTVVCADNYGGRQELTTQRPDCTFTGLTPSTLYTITVAPSSTLAHLEGEVKTTAQTVSRTEITEFTATPVSSSIVELSWVVGGTIPESMTLTYSAAGHDTISQPCSGGTARVTELVGGTDYSFTLSAGDATELSGQTSIICRTPDYTHVDSFTATAVNPSTIQLDWSFEGTDPEIWTVTRYNPDGTEEVSRVTETGALISGLSPDTELEFTLSAAEEFDVIGQIRAAASTSHCAIGEVTVTPGALGELTAAWSSDGLIPDEWTIILTGGYPDGNAVIFTAPGSESSFAFSGLYPSTLYTVTVSAPEEYLAQPASGSGTTIDAERYTEFGLSAASMALYLEPGIANWGDGNLTTRRSYFYSSESIAYSVNASYTSGSGTRTAAATILVRNTDTGGIVGLYEDEFSWSGSLRIVNHTGTVPETPQTAGSYRLEIYFDGRLLSSSAFTLYG